MMLLLPLAMLTIAIVHWRAAGARKSITDAIVFVTTWMVSLTPITIRNYIMSGRAVLLTAGQGVSFVAYNMPVDDKRYFAGFDGTLFNAATILRSDVHRTPDHLDQELRDQGGLQPGHGALDGLGHRASGVDRDEPPVFREHRRDPRACEPWPRCRCIASSSRMSRR